MWQRHLLGLFIAALARSQLPCQVLGLLVMVAAQPVALLLGDRLA